MLIMLAATSSLKPAPTSRPFKPLNSLHCWGSWGWVSTYLKLKISDTTIDKQLRAFIGVSYRSCLLHQALCTAIQSLTTILSFPRAPQSLTPQRPLTSQTFQTLASSSPACTFSHNPAKIPFPVIPMIFLVNTRTSPLPWPLVASEVPMAGSTSPGCSSHHALVATVGE